MNVLRRRVGGKNVILQGDVMATKNWAATAAAAGKKLTGKKQQARAAAVIQTAAFEALESRQLLSATLDTTFGTGGKVLDGFGTGIATLIQSDGKILVGG